MIVISISLTPFFKRNIYTKFLLVRKNDAGCITVNKQPTISLTKILITGIHVNTMLFGSPNILNDLVHPVVEFFNGIN